MQEMQEMQEMLKLRLKGLGLELKKADEGLLDYALLKVINSIKTDCNISELPEELRPVAVDMAAGELLLAKKTLAPADIAGLDLSPALKQIQVGDTNTVFAAGEGSLTPEQRLDILINRLLNKDRGLLAAYRRFRW